MALKEGYILHSDSEWVQFHLAHSIGKCVGYCRGAGAPMKNVRPGGKLFFVTRDKTVKHVVFWANFIDDHVVTVDEAWDQFGTELGSATKGAWERLVARLPAIKSKGELRVIRADNVFAPFNPISLRDAGVVEVRYATKGWSIDQIDVNRILGLSETQVASDIAAPAPGRLQTSVSRIIRDTALVNDVKRRHNYCCQICGTTILLADGSRYAEGHHVQPLGAPHNGPDVSDNILCVCPNHHAACDLGAIRLDATTLTTAAGHMIGVRFIEYHNRAVYRGS